MGVPAGPSVTLNISVPNRVASIKHLTNAIRNAGVPGAIKTAEALEALENQPGFSLTTQIPVPVKVMTFGFPSSSDNDVTALPMMPIGYDGLAFGWDANATAFPPSGGDCVIDILLWNPGDTAGTSIFPDDDHKVIIPEDSIEIASGTVFEPQGLVFTAGTRFQGVIEQASGAELVTVQLYWAPLNTINQFVKAR